MTLTGLGVFNQNIFAWPFLSVQRSHFVNGSNKLNQLFFGQAKLVCHKDHFWVFVTSLEFWSDQ